MKLGSTFLRPGLLGAVLSGFWAAVACSGGGGGGYVGTPTEQYCGRICQRQAKAEQELGCAGNSDSLCFEQCRVQAQNCSDNLLGAVANCVAALDQSAYVCGPTGEATPSGNPCNAEYSAWIGSCNAGSGGNGGSAGNTSSGGSSAGGSVSQGGTSGSGGISSGGSGGSVAGSTNGGSTSSGGSAGTLGGGGSGPQPGTCQGTRTPCADLDLDDCEFAPGCAWGGACAGDPLPCSEFGDADCEDQVGCSWDTDFEECAGTAVACSTRADLDSCEDHLECEWTEACTGTATACTLLGEDQCFDAPGCEFF